MDRLKELKDKEADLTDDEKVELKKLEDEAKTKAEADAKAKADADAKTEVTEEVEVSPDVMKALESTIQDAVSKSVKDQVSLAVESIEKSVDKRVAAPVIAVTSEIEQLPKERRFFKGLKALIDGDRETLTQCNKYALDARKKSGGQNVGDDAQGGYLVPDPDFEAEVIRLEEQYGVAARNARVRTVTSDSLKMNKKASGVTMVETGEGIAKTGTKMTFDQDTVTLRKFAGITPVTDELKEDMATDVFRELAIDYAREASRIEDVLVFTDPATGIIRTAGCAAVTVGAGIVNITFDHLSTAITSVPTDSMTGGKFYLHRTVLTIIQQIKDTANNYIWKPGPDGYVNGTIWGYPYELTEVLLSSTDVGDANEPYIIFGNLKYTTMIRKAGLKMDLLKEATVAGADAVDINLAEQDMTAVRAVIRRNNVVQFPEAFCLLGTGTVS